MSRKVAEKHWLKSSAPPGRKTRNVSHPKAAPVVSLVSANAVTLWNARESQHYGEGEKEFSITLEKTPKIPDFTTISVTGPKINTSTMATSGAIAYEPKTSYEGAF